ncbi:MAG: 2-oxo-4-hydroxy-4-carboxy-5-ureidoimidazoline decarboxylase [Acidobacteriota bacterium]|nr:2-oxo-4-hydroxy-4-carboxy-5-ureidoimidazoline decarboxylase [Acidobacteriota bacterium]
MDRWQELDRAAPADALATLSECCGSSRWAGRMVARRPFGSREALLTSAREEWWALSADDWLEAFSHHPRIGDRASLAARFPATHHLSAREQSAVPEATEDVLTALADANQAYVDRFGFIFIVCATGKTANEMLDLLRARLPNDRDPELRIAAEEQAKITALRLDAP